MSDRLPRPSGASAPRPDEAAFEATADALARRALAALPATVGRDDLDALAPPVGRLLAARLDAALDQATPTSPWVGGDEVDAALDSWRQVARAAVRIPADEREAEVRQATQRALAHLVRPAETLATAAFEGHAGPLPVAVALDRIHAFGPYPYLPQIAERYAERKELDHIDHAGLERLLHRIDRRMVSAFGADDWLALLAPLFEWVGSVGQPPGSVPTVLLRMLLEAKGADALLDTLGELDAVDAEALRPRFARALPAPSRDLEAAASTPSGELPKTAPEAHPPPPGEPGEGAPNTAPDWEPSAPAGADAAFAREPSNSESASQASEDPDVAPHSDDEGQTGPPPSPTDEEAPSARPAEPPAETAQPAADGPAPDESPDEEDLRPPVIGSRYGTPEFEGADESEVLGPPRPVAQTPAEDDPMEEVRAALVDEDAAPRSAPPVPVLDLAPPSRPAPPVPLAEAETETAGEPEEAQPSDAPGADADPAGPEPEDEPLWMRLARERGAEPQPPPPADADEDTPLWKRFAESDLAERLPDPEPSPLDPPTAAASGAPGPLDDLEARVLGDDAHERRDWFVAELFGGSAGDYRQTLAAIDRAPSYTDATAVISAEVLRKRSVSPYTDCAVAFIDAVQARFERR